ncbi:MAG: DUF58 domain-containing protein [Planctomycetota bacterium]|nr:DUF58 domain-containing protein [Planctomycetota bacterium]
MLALDAGLLVAAGLDWFLTPAPKRCIVERTVPETVGLSNRFERRTRLRFDPPTSRPLEVEVHEEFPPAFEVCARTGRGGLEELSGAAGVAGDSGDPSGGPDLAVLKDGEVEIVRIYRSHVRGVHRLGDLRLRIRGPLGLVERQRRLYGSQHVAVEPALTNLKQTLRLAASERWFDLGVRKLRRRGGRTEFESLRDYVQGDDPRHVDWKAFARRGKPTVRQFQEERGQELILVVDCGRRMRATTVRGRRRGWTKLDWALDAALQLAAVALSKGDRVGAAAFDQRIHVFVAPARSSRQLARLNGALFHLQPGEGASDLERALRELAVRHRRRALVIVLSDVADPFSVDHQRRALAAASKRHRLIFAALDDPSVRSAAAGEDVSAAERAAALELVEDRRLALRRLAVIGVRVLDALPAEAAGPLLAAWLDERRSFRG